jgi:carbon monoxide dehydrogenase subunit G
MDFKIDAELPATAAQLWAIFFDVRRVATLIPGCEDVVEVDPLKAFSAVMKQKIGPFKLEVPTRITIESYVPQSQVALKAAGKDKLTGTTIDVHMDVGLEEQSTGGRASCKLEVSASMQVAGRLASLGYPIVRKRSEELFAEFERRLRAELAGVDGSRPGHTKPVATGTATVSGESASRPVAADSAIDASVDASVDASMDPGTSRPFHVPHGEREYRVSTNAKGSRNPGRTELVFLWPRLGINVAVAVGVAHGAVAFGQSPWWWLAAPLLGVAASLGRRGD